MASFDFCIDDALSKGKITKDLAERIKGAEDTETAINNIVGDIARQKRESAISAIRLADAWEKMNSYETPREGRKNLKLYDALIALMTKDASGKAGYMNVEYLGRFYEGKYFAQFADAVSRFRTRMLGFSQDEAGLTKLVKAIYGEAVDDHEVMKFAEDWKKLTEDMRLEFNEKGGSISKNERWLMPQNHDAAALNKVGLDKWKEAITPMLDREQMLDANGKPLSDTELDEALNFTYETITSFGLNKAKDFTVKPTMGSKLSRKGSEKRFLFFKDADSWLEYQKEFGKGDIFTTLTDHIEMKANDIALMEIFGTNPESTFKALKTQVEKNTKLHGGQKMLLDALFNVVSGKTNSGDITGVADFMQSTRNIITASTLGGAFLSALSDTAFSALTARYNNIPSVKVFKTMFSQLNPANEVDRVFAVKMGLLADNWLGRANGANRYSDTFGTGVTSKAAEAVMRASLLAPWTDAGRKAFGMEFGAMLAENFGKSINELDDAVQKAFKHYGITEADWDTFRKTKPLEHKGAKFADMTQDAGKKFHIMVMSETDFAVPTPDARVRAITTGGLGRATIEGQAWRSVMMLKSFPITYMTTHFTRAMYQATTADKIGYTATLLATTTIMGGVSLQAKDIAAGREPRPMDNPEFLGAAFIQGGGVGIFGDYLFSDVNRFGGGVTQTFFGPIPELADKTASLVFPNGYIREAVLNEETNVLGKYVQFLKRYTPDIWQTRLLTDAFFDQIELMADPSAQRRFNRVVKKRQEDYNQGYWWSPGETTPDFLQ